MRNISPGECTVCADSTTNVFCVDFWRYICVPCHTGWLASSERVLYQNAMQNHDATLACFIWTEYLRHEGCNGKEAKVECRP